MKRIIALLLALCLMASIFVGCSPDSSEAPSTVDTTQANQGGNGDSEGNSNLTAPGEFPILNEKETYTIMIQQPAYIEDFDTNDFFVWYEELTNIGLEIEAVPSVSLREKVNLTLNASKVPEAFLNCGFTTTDLVKYGTQGLFLPLNDLYETQGHYSKQVFENNDLLPESITASDGNFYGLPDINECTHCFNSGRAWINQEWLDNLGLDYPTTTDELYEVLKAFDEQDANGNGDPNDEIPMMGSDTGWNTRPYDYLLSAFVYNDYVKRLEIVDGTINFVADDPEFKEGLLYIKKLIDEGLLDPVSLTQTEEQFLVSAGNPEAINVGVVTGALWWTGLGLYDTDPLKRADQYVGLSPIEGPNGDRFTLTTTNQGGIDPGKFVITKDATNPEALYRWADGHYEEDVFFRGDLGEEDVYWKKAEEGQLNIYGEQAWYEVISTNVGSVSENTYNHTITGVAVTNRDSEFRAGRYFPPKDDGPNLEVTTADYYVEFSSDRNVPRIMFEPETADKISQLEPQIIDYVTENMVAFLSGNRDIESEWDAYVSEFEALKADEWVALYQSGYDLQYN